MCYRKGLTCYLAVEVAFGIGQWIKTKGSKWLLREGNRNGSAAASVESTNAQRTHPRCFPGLSA